MSIQANGENRKTARGIYDEAKVHYEAKRYDEALPLLRQAAEKGSLHASYTLGQMYENSIGVPQDFSEARAWYMKIYDAGDRAILDELHALAWKEQRAKGAVPPDAVPQDEELTQIRRDAMQTLDDLIDIEKQEK